MDGTVLSAIKCQGNTNNRFSTNDVLSEIYIDGVKLIPGVKLNFSTTAKNLSWVRMHLALTIIKNQVIELKNKSFKTILNISKFLFLDSFVSTPIKGNSSNLVVSCFDNCYAPR